MPCFPAQLQSPAKSFLRPSTWMPGAKSFHVHTERWKVDGDPEQCVDEMMNAVERLNETEHPSEYFVNKRKKIIVPVPSLNIMAGGRGYEEREKTEVLDHKTFAVECMQKLHRNVREDVASGNMGTISRKCFEKLRTLYQEYRTEEQRRDVGDLIADMGVAQIFMKYAKTLGKDDCLAAYNDECFDVMRRVFRNFTDASEKLRIECGKTRVLSAVTLDLKSNQDSIGIETDQASLAILHNCARTEENFRYFMEAGTVQVLQRYREEPKSKLLEMLVVLTLSYIMNDNEKQSAGKPVIDFLLEYLKNAASSCDHRYDGFTVEDLVDGLLHLAKNDQNKILIAQSEVRVLDIFADLMKNWQREEEKRLCVETVGTLSFLEEKFNCDYRIGCHSEIMKLLEKVAESSRPYKYTATRTLWIIKKANSEAIIRPAQDDFTLSNGVYDTNERESMGEAEERTPAESPEKKHIMISYAHRGPKDTARKIADRLCERGYQVWFDADSMKGHPLNAMAEAVENSAVVVMCVSRQYKDSPNCRMEALYAQERKVPLFPVVVQEKYKPDGWLGILKAANLYFDFSSSAKFEENFYKLVKHIGKRGMRPDEAISVAQQDEPLQPNGKREQDP